MLMISQSDVESGLMSRQTAMSGRTAMSEIDQKKKLISSTIEQAKRSHLKVLRSATTAKDENLECSTSPIEFEWCGTKYSRKCGSLLSYESLDTSDEQLQVKYMAAVAQDPNYFSKQKLMQHIGWTISHTDINNYTIKQVKQILQNTEIESKHLANLEHENVIKFYGIFYEENKLPVLIMEPIQCDLHEFLNRSISWNCAFSILQGISKGLSYLHDGTGKAPVAKLTSFELAIVLPNNTTAEEESRLKSSDVFCFGQVLVNIIQCTEHTEKKFHSLFESMHEFAVECLSLRNRPTSAKILDTIVKYRCQYESGGDDGHDGSSHDHSTGLLYSNDTIQDRIFEQDKLRKENEQLKNQVAQTKDEAKSLELKLMEIEEKNFKLTNAFTTADSRSPLKISEDYRYIQQHYRAAAARAHRKMHSKCSPVPPFHEHTMIAYHKAKELILVASTQYIQKSLFDLQHQPDEGHNVMENVVTDLRGVQLMMNELHDDHNLTVDSIDAIEKTLIKAYKDHINQQDSVPTEVKDYYSRLAKLTWNAVAKAIPMVLSTEAKYYDATIHELNDEPEDGIDSSATYMVEYIYPILFTSNHHPREVALKGKVKISVSQ